MPRRLTHREAVARLETFDFWKTGARFYPSVEYPGVAKAWLGKCGAGHKCSPSLASLRRGRGPCYVCGKQASTQARRFSNEQAMATLRTSAHGSEFTPVEPYPGNNLLGWGGVCAAGHACRPTLANLQQGAGPCDQCSGTKRHTHSEAVALLETFPFRLRGQRFAPSSPYPGSHRPWRGRCGNGHDCEPRFFNLQRGRGACQICGGHNQDRYYICVSAEMVKPGVANNDRRTRHHVGMHEAHMWLDLPDGEARLVETLVLDQLAKDGFRPVRGREFFDIAAYQGILSYATSLLGPETREESAA